jgi:hypothetical protein
VQTLTTTARCVRTATHVSDLGSATCKSTDASPANWPQRLAFIAASLFTAASFGTNIAYGWGKGDSVISCTIWAAVAGAVAIVFALSWPALIKSMEARRWSAALVALIALSLTGSYSMTAALGSAAGGRANAATVETASTETRKRLRASYDAARAELDVLKPTRPVAELEALVAAARPTCRIVVTHGRRDTVCTPAPSLMAELGRAKRRAELERKLESTSAVLAETGPAKTANSDAKALSRYLSAIGADIGAERLNDILVLLSVLVIEAGGGLSLAIGMTLNRTPVVSEQKSSSTIEQPEWRHADAPDTSPDTACKQIEQTIVRPGSVVEWLQQQGGRAETSMRRLADAVGRSPSGVHDELRRLVSYGLITAVFGPRGTVLAVRRT